jgi:hypothetical protein
MAAPKFKDLYKSSPDQNLRDKQKIEALIERLNQQIAHNPRMAKKAALLLSQWISKK